MMEVVGETRLDLGRNEEVDGVHSCTRKNGCCLEKKRGGQKGKGKKERKREREARK